MSESNRNQNEQLSTDEESVLQTEKRAVDLNANLRASIKNPLAGISRAQLLRSVEEFAKEKEMFDILPILSKGAIRTSFECCQHQFCALITLRTTQLHKTLLNSRRLKNWILATKI